MRSVELRWLSFYVFDTNSLLGRYFSQSFVAFLKNDILWKEIPAIMQVDKQSFGEGEGKKRFFLGVGDGDVQEERIYM